RPVVRAEPDGEHIQGLRVQLGELPGRAAVHGDGDIGGVRHDRTRPDCADMRGGRGEVGCFQFQNIQEGQVAVNLNGNHPSTLVNVA
ncbi:hypothetical protein THAOC_23297, partial [Thalassiosira oceanica]